MSTGGQSTTPPPTSQPVSDDESTDTSTPANSAPANGPADAASSASATDDTDECAAIRQGAHAVLVAEFKLVVQIPLGTDAAIQISDKLTLTSEDGSYNKTLSFATDCQPGDTEGTSVVTFDGMTDGHTYTLSCDDGATTSTLFKDIPYDQIVAQVGAQCVQAPVQPPDGPDDGSGGDHVSAD
jgi:hypothetical protein